MTITSLQASGCKAAKSHANSSWALPSLRWGSGKEPVLGGLGLFPVSDNVRGLHGSSPEKDAEQIQAPGDEDAATHCSQSETTGKRRQERKLHRTRAAGAGDSRHRDDCAAAPESHAPASVPHKPLTSQVPLRLQIKVCGQRGSLGISIAGGKGSLPYKETDEGIFISRVSKGGPAEKAGVHVGDRVLEVNGLDMQEVTHHEAVSALRNAGSCIKLKVLRERAAAHEAPTAEDPLLEKDVLLSGPPRGPGDQRQQPSTPEAEPDEAQRIKAVVICNGNGLRRSECERDRSETPRGPEASLKTSASATQAAKSTMTIPRIILTHPSTSDEDTEPLAHSGGDEDANSAFYPP
ncbi:protein scribble homolog [Denticeps clupeoides]|uniref:protein scribble homolog n=1 Tax=Denticeps clupeoides TaxID=299321 RepID=UPI0010A32F2C|nr:protein scribble homolog [Denticeps clupeoides]